jgi:hypothetical protein
MCACWCVREPHAPARPVPCTKAGRYILQRTTHQRPGPGHALAAREPSGIAEWVRARRGGRGMCCTASKPLREKARRGGERGRKQVLHRKYALGLGWALRPFTAPDAAAATRPPPEEHAGEAVTAAAASAASRTMMSAVLDRAEDVVRRAAADFSCTFASSFAQGTLLALRYLLLDAPLPAAASHAAAAAAADASTADAAAWRGVMVRALGLMGDVAAVAIGAMAGCPPERVGGGGGGGRPLVVGGAAVSAGLFGSMYRKTDAAGDAGSRGPAGGGEGLATPHSVQRNLGVGAAEGGGGGWGGTGMLRAMQRNTGEGPLTAQEATATHAHADSVALLRRWAGPGAGAGVGASGEGKEGPDGLETGGGLGMGEEADGGGDDDGELGGLGPREQLVVVSCWLSLKEAALVVGGMVGRLRIDDAVAGGVLAQAEVEACGGLLVDMVFSTLHNGAIEKARLGFQVTSRLSASPERTPLVYLWRFQRRRGGRHGEGRSSPLEPGPRGRGRLRGRTARTPQGRDLVCTWAGACVCTWAGA